MMPKSSTPNLAAAGMCKQCGEMLTLRAKPEEIRAGATEEHVIIAFSKTVLAHLVEHSILMTAEKQPIMDRETGQPRVVPGGPHAILGELNAILMEVFALRSIESMDPRLADRQDEAEQILDDWLNHTVQSKILTPEGKPTIVKTQ